MKVIHIYYVRLENGKNIAQYASSAPSPKSGKIIDLSSIGTPGLFEVLSIKETPFIGDKNIIVVTARPSSMWVLDQKTIESGLYYDIHAMDAIQIPPSRMFLGILKVSESLGTGLGRLLSTIIIFALLFYLRRFIREQL